jgi:hypothetical protein
LCHLLSVDHARFPSEIQQTERDNKVNIPYYNAHIFFGTSCRLFVGKCPGIRPQEKKLFERHRRINEDNDEIHFTEIGRVDVEPTCG